MFYDKILEGRYVYLRSIEVEDAQFSLSIRQNESLTKFLPKLNISIEQQKAWILHQQKTLGDYFFIIENKKHEKIGVIGVYNVDKDSAETGRLASIGNPLESLEAQYLSFLFAFNELQLKSTRCYILKDNTKAIHLSEFFGTLFSDPYKNHDGDIVVDGFLSSYNFCEKENKIKRMLYRN